jgi:hypothetical protein
LGCKPKDRDNAGERSGLRRGQWPACLISGVARGSAALEHLFCFVRSDAVSIFSFAQFIAGTAVSGVGRAFRGDQHMDRINRWGGRRGSGGDGSGNGAAGCNG